MFYKWNAPESGRFLSYNMTMQKGDWLLILFALLVVVMIILNELGYGVFALPLLFPAGWLMRKDV